MSGCCWLPALGVSNLRPAIASLKSLLSLQVDPLNCGTRKQSERSAEFSILCYFKIYWNRFSLSAGSNIMQLWLRIWPIYLLLSRSTFSLRACPQVPKLISNVFDQVFFLGVDTRANLSAGANVDVFKFSGINVGSNTGAGVGTGTLATSAYIIAVFDLASL